MKLFTTSFFVISFCSFTCGLDIENINSLFENQKECLVHEKKSETNKPCEFPFIYENETYHGCTTKILDVDSGEFYDGTPWCSTKTDPITMEHLPNEGLWGDCPQDNSCTTDEQGMKAEWDWEEIHINGANMEYFGTSTRSIGNALLFPQNEVAPCECKPFRSCPWVAKTISSVTRLSRNHPKRQMAISFLLDRSCNAGRTLNKVYCCEGGTFPTDAELQYIKNKDDPNLPEVNIKSTGKWKPSGSKKECGKRISLSNIVGGKITKNGDFPYMALLGKTASDGKNLWSCGGSLINKWYVLTAAHCIRSKTGDDNPPEQIVFGEHVVGTDPDCKTKRGLKKCAPKVITRTVSKTIVHENYNTKDNKNDIALLRLNESVPLFNENPMISAILPVCLPWPDEELFTEDAEKGIVTGWGRITNNLWINRDILIKNRAGSRVQRKVEVPIVNMQKCISASYPDLDPKIQICAGGKAGQDSCSGDSGGPLVWREYSDDPWYQIGVVSFGAVKCGTKDIPGVYTRVEAYLPWIKSNLEA